jgi:hypothetical protein
MSANPSIESNLKKQANKSFQQFEQTHREEITAVSLIVAKITNCSVEEVQPHLETMLSRLIKPKNQKISSSNRAQEFREWVKSHKDMNLPVLSDEAISRESIYGEKG